jgi:hypothetical protein
MIKGFTVIKNLNKLLPQNYEQQMLPKRFLSFVTSTTYL